MNLLSDKVRRFLTAMKDFVLQHRHQGLAIFRPIVARLQQLYAVAHGHSPTFEQLRRISAILVYYCPILEHTSRGAYYAFYAVAFIASLALADYFDPGFFLPSAREFWNMMAGYASAALFVLCLLRGQDHFPMLGWRWLWSWLVKYLWETKREDAEEDSFVGRTSTPTGFPCSTVTAISGDPNTNTMGDNDGTSSPTVNDQPTPSTSALPPIITPPTPQLPPALRGVSVVSPIPQPYHGSGIIGPSPNPPQFKHFDGRGFRRRYDERAAVGNRLLIPIQEEEGLFGNDQTRTGFTRSLVDDTWKYVAIEGQNEGNDDRGGRAE